MVNNNVPIDETIKNSGLKDVPEWLNENLFQQFLQNDFTNFQQITNFNVKPAVQTGENYMTIMLRVLIEVELKDSNKASTSYMIKIQPTPEKLRTIIRASKIFLKEYTTYTKYIPAFEQYYKKAGLEIKFGPLLLEPAKTKIDDDFIILEDLRPKGFKNFNRHVGLDLLHTKAVLQKLAQYHAASAQYFNEHGPYPTMYDQTLTTGKDSFDAHNMKINKILRDHLHLYGDFKYLEDKLKIYAENQSQIKYAADQNGFNVLNHGDCWTNNIMFQYDQNGELNETYLIDLQMCRFGSPAQDLLYFLLSSTNLEVKVKHFDYFICYYHQQLMEHLKLLRYEGKLPKLRDIHIDLLKNDNWAYKTVSMIMPVILCESRDDATADTLINDKSDDLRKAMYSSSLYVKNMNMLLPWLNNRGTFDV